MARTVRDANLETRTGRSRLKPAGKPYYRAIDEGLHVGYRKGKTAGKWVMRRYTGGTYIVETIATADDTLDADGAEILTFSQAQAIARERFVEERRVASGLPAKGGPYTVSLCVNEYIDWLELNRKSSSDARFRADALILPHLGDVECSRLTDQAAQGLEGSDRQGPCPAPHKERATAEIPGGRRRGPGRGAPEAARLHQPNPNDP